MSYTMKFAMLSYSLAQLFVVCSSSREVRDLRFREALSGADLKRLARSAERLGVQVRSSRSHGQHIDSQAVQKHERFAFLAIPVVIKGVPVVVHWASANLIPAAWHAALGACEFCKTSWIKTAVVETIVDATTCAEALYSNFTNSSNSGKAAHAAEQLGAAYEVADALYAFSEHGLTYTALEIACAKALKGLTNLLGKEKVIHRYCGNDHNEDHDPLPEVLDSNGSPDWPWCPNLHGVAAPDADSIEKAIDHYRNTNWLWTVFGGADVQIATDMICGWAMQEAYKGKMDLSCPDGETIPYEEWNEWFDTEDDRRQPICEWLQE